MSNIRFGLQRSSVLVLLLLVLVSSGLSAGEAGGDSLLPGAELLPWCGWSLLLFVFCFILGIAAIVAGVGGGILYVPIVSAVFPFHLDFVRGSGLLVALAGALSAAPRLLGSGMASLRLAMPMALAGSVGSLIGAHVGLALPSHVVELSLGIVILFIVGLMLLAKRSDYPLVPSASPLSFRLGIAGSYIDGASGDMIHWKIHHLIPGFFLFFVIGFMAGMFGLGAGWANVPALNLLLGAPLKVSVATSILIIAVNGSAASWVYLNQGAVLPVIAVPSVAGMMLGTRIGAKMLHRVKPGAIRWIVIGFLVLAGLRSFLAGLGVAG
jgi:uncharacterized membrane protein YfcA